MTENYLGSVKKFGITRILDGVVENKTDLITVEEPLEIQIKYFEDGEWKQRQLVVTMRTPGDDKALAIGFLFTEGIIGVSDIFPKIEQLEAHRLIIRLDKNTPVSFNRLERHFFSSSSCGVCGIAAIENLEKTSCYFPRIGLPRVNIEVIERLPTLLQSDQSLFTKTGGIHAAGLFSKTGNMIALQEDVGRHNALDKLIGTCLLEGGLPLRNHILMLSGRISFELVQKTMMTGIPVITAIGAPSSLAVELAEEVGITLIGFLKEKRFNVYCGAERLILA